MADTEVLGALLVRAARSVAPEDPVDLMVALAVLTLLVAQEVRLVATALVVHPRPPRPGWWAPTPSAECGLMRRRSCVRVICLTSSLQAAVVESQGLNSCSPSAALVKHCISQV